MESRISDTEWASYKELNFIFDYCFSITRVTRQKDVNGSTIHVQKGIAKTVRWTMYDPIRRVKTFITWCIPFLMLTNVEFYFLKLSIFWQIPRDTPFSLSFLPWPVWMHCSHIARKSHAYWGSLHLIWYSRDVWKFSERYASSIVDFLQVYP